MQDSAGTTTWAYDALDRLTSASYPNGDAVSYAYDAVGNRTGLTVNGQTTTSTFDAADELTASGATAYTYGQNGNQLTKAAGGVATTYSYDPLNQLTGIAVPTTASYAYNGDGLRVGKTVGGTTTTYTWDLTGIGRVLGDGSEYLWGDGLIGQVTSVGAVTYAHADGLGSVRLLTDGAGNVAGRAQYDAYGAPRAQSGTQLPFTYTGEQTDPESGLVYLRARYMDPASGRFLTHDPLAGSAAAPSSLHRYLYAAANPATATDPSGQETCFGPVAIGGGLMYQTQPVACPSPTPVGGGATPTATPIPNIDLPLDTPTPAPAPSPMPTPAGPDVLGPSPTPQPAEPSADPAPCPLAGQPYLGGSVNASTGGAPAPTPTPTPGMTEDDQLVGAFETIVKYRLMDGDPVPEGVDALIQDAHSPSGQVSAGAIRVMKAILHNVHGVDEVAAVRRQYRDANGVQRDVDILLRDGSAIEVGGPGKSADTLGQQLAGLQYFVTNNRRSDGSVPGVYYLYAAGTPRDAIETARRRLGNPFVGQIQ